MNEHPQSDMRGRQWSGLERPKVGPRLRGPKLVVPYLTWLWAKTVLGFHFGVGEFTTHFRTYFSGDWDVHWGYGFLTHDHMFAFDIFSRWLL